MPAMPASPQLITRTVVVPLEWMLARLQLLSAQLPSGMIPNTPKQDSHAGFC